MTQRCGAKTRSGRPCQQWPMHGKKRCRIHGGLSTGPPKGTQNNYKYGIYANLVRPDEKEIYENIKVGSLDDDIRIMKLQLMRAIKAQEEFEEKNLADESGLETVEKKRTKFQNENEGWKKSETTKKHPDYRKIIFQLSGRVAKLELTRSVIKTGEGDENIDWKNIGFRAAEAANISTDTASKTNRLKRRRN